MAFGLFFDFFFTYLSYHVDRSAKSTPIHRYNGYFPSCTEYVANLVSRSKTGAVSCSRASVYVANKSGAAQLACSVIIPRHDFFVIPVDLKYNPNWFHRFFVAVFDRVKRSLMSGDRRISISSAGFAWRTGLKPGIIFACAFVVFLGTNEGFLDSVGFTSLAKNLHVILATFMASVRSLATDRIEDALSRERSDMLGST